MTVVDRGKKLTIKRVERIRDLASDLSRDLLRSKPQEAASEIAQAIADDANAILRALKRE